MKLKLFFGALNMMALCAAGSVAAQNYQQMPILSGFTADVIANGVGSSAVTTNSDVDGVSFAFVSRDFQLTSSSTPLTYGLPTDGLVNSVVASTPGLSYKLANYNSNNSLKLANQNDTGTLVFSTPTAAFKLYMLATSGSGASTVTVVVNFTDNTSQTFTGVAIADWYNATGFAIQGFGRINRTNDTLESGSGTNPRLYQSLLTIDPANQMKPIQSVTITKTSTAQGYSNIFAFAADAYSDCVPPVLNAVGTLTANSAAVSWTPGSGTSTSYDIYYSTTNTAPTSGSTPNITGLTGTSTTIPGLNANTNYYYWVRSNCSSTTGQSAWSFSGTFKTLCGPMTSMFEDFESYSTGSIVPDCWARIIDTNGSQTISTSTPVASGTKHIYQYSSTTQNPTTVVLPQFSNINAGTHWLRFKARVSTATGTLNVGYVTDAANSSTFVPLQALSIANTVYATAGNEYSVIVPSSVPANARLAIRNTADAKSYYYDDVYWEPKPTCFAPSALTSSNVLANTAGISWTAPSSTPGNGYEYYYSTSSTTPTAATAASGTSTSTSTTINGLAPATTYYVWIRSACSSSDKSSWWGSVTFTTACATLNAPFAQTFDNGTAPNCWINVNPTATTTNANLLWKFAGNADYGANLANNGRPAGTFAWVDASSPYSGAGVNTVQLITPYVSLVGLTAPYVSFDWYKNHSTSTSTTVSPSTYDNNKLTVEVNDGTGWVNIWSDTSNSNQWRTVGVALPSSYVGATIQVRFTVDKSVNGNGYFYDDLLLDNVEIKQNPTILATNEVLATKNTVKIYPNPFKDVLYIAETKEAKSVSIADVSGRVVKTIENPGKELQVSELKSGLYLVTVVFKDGSRSTVKAIKQ